METNDISVTKRDPQKSGGCTACSERVQTVYEIMLRTASIRLCNDCMKELIAKAKEA